MTPDEITAQLDAWLAARPRRPLKDWERRVLDLAGEVPVPDEDYDATGRRADEEAARWENQWERQAGWNR